MAKKHKHEEHENHERWLVSYADFITLLFAFFVVLYASSTQSESKTKSAEDSIRSSLHLVLQGGGGADLINMETGAMVAPIGSHALKGSPVDMQRFYQKQIESKLSEEERGKSIQDIEADLHGVRIRLVGSNLFNPGSSQLNPISFDALKKIGDVIRKTKHPIIIEGHTDNQQVADGSFESNWELGALRATSVLRHMQNQLNFQNHRMAATTYADTKPLTTNDTPEGRAKNRRIEIYILTDDPDGKSGDKKDKAN